MNNVKMSAIGLAVLMSSAVMAGERVDETVSTSADSRVSIDVQSGKVEIKTWDKNVVQVRGELDDDAEGYEFVAEGDGRVVFKVHMPKRRWGSWNEEGSTLEFYMPVNSNLRFEGVNADVKAQDVKGGSKIHTVNGDVKASNLVGRIDLETVNGEINASGLSGDIELNTVNGEIRDESSQGEVQIETVNGDINTNTSADELNISNVNGDMDLQLAGVKELEISTVNGDIDLVLNAESLDRAYITTVGGDADVRFEGDVNAEFNIEAHSGGDITNRLTNDKVKKAKYGPGESLRFVKGKGKANIEIDTVSGDIKIRD